MSNIASCPINGQNVVDYINYLDDRIDNISTLLDLVDKDQWLNVSLQPGYINQFSVKTLQYAVSTNTIVPDKTTYFRGIVTVQGFVSTTMAINMPSNIFSASNKQFIIPSVVYRSGAIIPCAIFFSTQFKQMSIIPQGSLQDGDQISFDNIWFSSE